MTRRAKTIALFSTLLITSVFSFKKAGAQTPDLKAGEAKYQQLCTSCHGASGKGDGIAAANLNPKPRDLTKTTKTEADLKMIISKGGAAAGLSPLMPTWGQALSPQELANVVAFVRSLKK